MSRAAWGIGPLDERWLPCAGCGEETVFWVGAGPVLIPHCSYITSDGHFWHSQCWRDMVVNRISGHWSRFMEVSG